MIAENLAQIREKIELRCEKSGRNADKIKLIAVTKYFGTDIIEEAVAAGLTDFGENKAQELNLKYEKLGNKITWHFIGTLQKNKVKYAVKAAEFIHSVDSIELADEVDARAGKLSKVQKILLEVNTSSEESKTGLITEDDVFRLAEHCNKKNNLELIGLMTMAPFTDDEHVIRNSFSLLRSLKEKLIKNGFTKITELSMGMTNDYEIAVDEGATMLRIGSAIFGERDYSKDWREI
ncbi:MAG TPA: YggS family pyridoxal phosphate-dependent enzyme [Ignavibacteriaceae bacterium]|nr:YggS family pyridoxal phosphate-dependent enzyme [Ignavibacteriaceae bacterium]